MVVNDYPVNKYASVFDDNTSGVPRGSFLESVLFIIFLNDLPECCKNSHVLKFADDTKITTKCPYELQNGLLRLHAWAFEVKMGLIADKTKLIWFSLERPDVKEQPIVLFEDEDVYSLSNGSKILVSFLFQPSPGPHIEKRIHDACGRFINLK